MPEPQNLGGGDWGGILLGSFSGVSGQPWLFESLTQTHNVNKLYIKI